MSRLTGLLRQVDALDPELCADLKREVEALSGRRAFGLNFERHIPETIELPNRPARRGDKVRFLPERGQQLHSVDDRVWRVDQVVPTDSGRIAHLVRRNDQQSTAETTERAVEDLVVIAESAWRSSLRTTRARSNCSHGTCRGEWSLSVSTSRIWPTSPSTPDPSLNEQTRSRIREGADRIPGTRLVVIDNAFSRPKLEPGNVYFLNAQKLGRNSLLVRGAPDDSEDNPQTQLPMPDARAFTKWQTLANTIADERLTLYVILDEAHRGTRLPITRERNEKATIVQRLVNGAHGAPPVPIVWGISATIERFNDAMAHVFGDHAPIKLAAVTVPHIAPETVLDRTHIRVLFAKDAISTGWDCPRAEVLVSFRPAKDETHITQLLGRMVRMPLARRIPGNDLLDSVACVLPHFNRTTATKVASNMLGEREHETLYLSELASRY